MATVSELIASAQTYAASMVAQASSAMTTAETAVSAVGFLEPNATPVVFGEDPPKATGVELPDHPDIEFVVPVEPVNDLVFQDMDPLDLHGEPDPFNEPRPTFDDPNKPNQLPDFKEVLQPLNLAFTFPDIPSELLQPGALTPPVLTDRTEPTRIGTITIPAFDSVLPVDRTIVPTDHQARFEGAYKGKTSEMVTMIDGLVDAMLAKRNPQYASQMLAIETQLTRYLAGGTGLNSSVENAIYERARGKNNAEALRVRNSAYDEAAGRGFTIPTGALLAITQSARQAGADNNARAANEIVVMQAEMEQRNLQFAVTTSTGLRTAMVQATLSYHQNLTTINGQALDYAKTVLNAVIEVYNTQVKMYGMQLEAYKADVATYDVKVRAAMAQVERYLAEVKGLEAMMQVDKSKVDVYRARIDALLGYANVYKAQIEATQGRIGLEKIKLDIFQTQVQAYTTQVQGKNAEWQGYSAAISGETAKINAYTAEVQAYNAQYQGYKIKLDAQNETMRYRIAHNQAKASEYQAQVTAFKTVVDARGAVANTKLAVQRQDLVAFQEKVQLAMSDANLKHLYYRTKSEVDMTNESRRLEAQYKGADNRRAYGQTIAQLGTAHAQSYSALASAAMAGMNTLVSNNANKNS